MSGQVLMAERPNTVLRLNDATVTVQLGKEKHRFRVDAAILAPHKAGSECRSDSVVRRARLPLSCHARCSGN